MAEGLSQHTLRAGGAVLASDVQSHGPGRSISVNEAQRSEWSGEGPLPNELQSWN